MKKDQSEYEKTRIELIKKREEWVRNSKSNDLNWNKFRKRIDEIELKTLLSKCKRLYEKCNKKLF